MMRKLEITNWIPSMPTPGPFRWTKFADDILANKRFCLRTLQIAECQTRISKMRNQEH